MTQRASLLYQEAKTLGHGGPCGPIALAILTDKTYVDAVKLCETDGHHNPKRGNGLKTTTMLKLLHELGYELHDITLNARLKKCKTIQSLGWALRDGSWNDEKLLIQTRDHFAAAVNGIIHDWSAGRKMHLVRVYRVVKS